ncbi:MAG: ribulose-phosphate 3-epimerase [Bacilli bacterium]|nr:ribulose-phosphate 3-epimerase [Bacilli bacterium]MDD3305148.1 ribulose-phosphate 3-epimerase [Bacilli bacterium]MDD4053668.1 ribulose-phosphate 3-epimerase [Bacilli bacterium]MDD4411167.1 ribulose-phosphate 3-epimerase [Bacilli bacterium]
MVKISVSVLSKNNRETIEKLNRTSIDYFHIDVMDGKFVDETNFSISKIEEVSNYALKKLDVHLMVEYPNSYIASLPLSKIEYITVHYESLNGDFSILEKIRDKGIKCGISIKPNTDVQLIFNLLDKIDLVLIMSVEPGYGGQDFLDSSLTKVRLLKSEIKNRNLPILISIDGGINNENSSKCIEAGCDMLVSGSYIISSNDYEKAVDLLRNV